ncbi:NAD-dependent epimerase/dehydratase family protein [candidate division KSB1 bacterium]|nr:NAD-dependent epimerase/dehydratase family protein [candidate division KSB1 bacterium]
MRKTGSTYSPFYALVLGGTGFIGSALINALQSRNHNVACLIHKRMCKQNIKSGQQDRPAILPQVKSGMRIKMPISG